MIFKWIFLLAIFLNISTKLSWASNIISEHAEPRTATKEFDRYAKLWGNAWLSPDGRFLAREIKCPLGTRYRNEVEADRIEIINVKTKDRIHLAPQYTSDFAWSLDNRSLFVTSVISVDEYPLGNILNQDFWQSAHRTIFINEGNDFREFVEYPRIDFLKSNLDFIPVITFRNRMKSLFFKRPMSVEVDRFGGKTFSNLPHKPIPRILQRNNHSQWWTDTHGMPVLSKTWLLSERSLNEKETLSLIHSAPNPMSSSKIITLDSQHLSRIYHPILSYKERTNQLTKSIALLSNRYSDKINLYSVDSGSFHVNTVLASEWFYDTNSAYIHQNGDLLGSSYYSAAQHFKGFNKQGAQLEGLITKHISKNEATDIMVLSFDSNAERVFIRKGGNPYYTDVLVNLKDGAFSELPSHCTSINFRTDAITHKNDYFRNSVSYYSTPLHKESDKTPIIIHLHGGPHIRDKLYPDAITMNYLELGFPVVRINYPGSFGFGKSYLEKLSGKIKSELPVNIIEQLAEIVTELELSGRQLILSGQSFGAYLTLEIAGNNELSEQFDFFISILPVDDISKAAAAYGKYGVNLINILPTDISTETPGITIPHKKPILLFWNENDKITPIENMKGFLEKNAGANILAIKMSDVGHSIDLTGLEKIKETLQNHNF